MRRGITLRCTLAAPEWQQNEPRMQSACWRPVAIIAMRSMRVRLPRRITALRAVTAPAIRTQRRRPKVAGIDGRAPAPAGPFPPREPRDARSVTQVIATVTCLPQARGKCSPGRGCRLLLRRVTI